MNNKILHRTHNLIKNIRTRLIDRPRVKSLKTYEYIIIVIFVISLLTIIIMDILVPDEQPTNIINNDTDTIPQGTTIIAAFDSGGPDKSRAKIICNGTDDQYTIQSAGNAAVVLLPGNYYFSGPLKLSGTGLSRVLGINAVIRLKNDANDLMFDSLGDNWTLEGLAIDGNSANQSIPGYCIYDSFYGNGNRAQIKNCSFYDFAKSCIYLRTSDGLVNNCTFNNIRGGGGEGAIHIRDKGCWNIMNNSFNMEQDESSASAIFLDYSSYNRVQNNTVNGGFHNIQVRAGQENTIKDNTLLNAYGSGCEIQKGTVGDMIIGNYIDNPSERGILIYDYPNMKINNCTATGNIIKRAHLEGIYCYGDNNTIMDNQLFYCGYGVVCIGENCFLARNMEVDCDRHLRAPILDLFN